MLDQAKLETVKLVDDAKIEARKILDEAVNEVNKAAKPAETAAARDKNAKTGTQSK